MSDQFDDLQFDWSRLTPDRSLERTPDMHGGAKEEQYQEVASGWYANCYCCSKSYDEQFMVRHEYRRETVIGVGWQATTMVTRYVISYCITCFKAFVKS